MLFIQLGMRDKLGHVRVVILRAVFPVNLSRKPACMEVWENNSGNILMSLTVRRSSLTGAMCTLVDKPQVPVSTYLSKYLRYFIDCFKKTAKKPLG